MSMMSNMRHRASEPSPEWRAQPPRSTPQTIVPICLSARPQIVADSSAARITQLHLWQLTNVAVLNFWAFPQNCFNPRQEIRQFLPSFLACQPTYCGQRVRSYNMLWSSHRQSCPPNENTPNSPKNAKKCQRTLPSKCRSVVSNRSYSTSALNLLAVAELSAVRSGLSPRASGGGRIRCNPGKQTAF